VVGGLEVLSLLEKVPTDSEDRPVKDISIKGRAAPRGSAR
jgi:hypothetical protein